MPHHTGQLDPFASARAMLDALEVRQVSATELLEEHLARIARYNPTLNALVIPNEEQARNQAAKADKAYEHGHWLGPLHGLPLTIKDCIEVAGLRTTAGAKELAEHVSIQSGPVAQRVLGAGAVLMGKTNVPPFAGDWQATNPIFGRTNNPWDMTRTPGGSTGGGAAALAAGLTPLEFGSDIGGSIRVPAAFCGLYGHRPSDTAVPRTGHIPGTPLPNPAVVMGVQGPLARSAGDLDLALSVIAGPVVGEDVAWRLELPAPRHTSLADFRVAILPRADWLPVDNEIVAALDDLAAKLRGLGATVAEAQPEGYDLRKHDETYTALLNFYIFADISDEMRAQMAEGVRESSNPFDQAFLLGLTASGPQVLRCCIAANRNARSSAPSSATGMCCWPRWRSRPPLSIPICRSVSASSASTGKPSPMAGCTSILAWQRSSATRPPPFPGDAPQAACPLVCRPSARISKIARPLVSPRCWKKPSADLRRRQAITHNFFGEVRVFSTWPQS